MGVFNKTQVRKSQGQVMVGDLEPEVLGDALCFSLRLYSWRCRAFPAAPSLQGCFGIRHTIQEPALWPESTYTYSIFHWDMGWQH